MLHRLLILIPIMIFVGLLLFFKDKDVGIAILAGTVLVLVVCGVYYYLLRKYGSVAAQKGSSIFFLLMGIALFVIGVAYYTLEKDFLRSFSYLFVGIIGIAYAVQRYRKIKS